ncbi:MAG: type II toxin-antitoxin system VapC family toxin [Actinopolymorphaceae bacterium]
MIHLDSCALIKLVVPEPESISLQRYLDQTSEPLSTSELATVEIHRALLRVEAADESHGLADQILERTLCIPVSAVVFAASHLPGRHIRSLDAVHLASAQRVVASAFVTYDKKLASAATEVGLHVVAPS